MFERLSHTFSSLFSRLSSQKKLTQADIADALAQVKDALLDADVPYDLVSEFVQSVQDEVVGQNLVARANTHEYLIKVVHDKLLAFFGGKQPVSFTFQLPATVMVIGLQGAGKTTTISKLVRHVQKEAAKRGKKRDILMASVDFQRPAAVEQLAQLADTVGAAFYRATNTNPVAAAREISAYAKKEGFELLFLDTAGRLHVDNGLLDELRQIDQHLEPRYKLLVLDAMTGQESLAVARAFENAVGFSGAVLTKMDSDTRGGAAFAFRYALKKPILFVGIGEKPDDLVLFHADRAVSRMLGMGDLESLLERVQETVSAQEQKQAEDAMKSGRLTLDDFAKQMEMVSKMGSLTNLMKHIPGMAGAQIAQQELEKGEAELKRFRAIISSMTKKERINPAILDGSRRKRVALGAGVGVAEVNLLIQRFEQAQQYVKLLKKSGSFKQFLR